MTRYALITGAGGRLGAAFTSNLARQRDWRLILADHDLPRAQQTLETVTVQGVLGEAVALNVSSLPSWESLITRLQEEISQLDLLINCAGVSAGGELGEMSLEDFYRVMEVNYFGTLNGCRAVLPWMKAQGAGHILNVASITGLIAPPAMGAYGSSKAAVVALSESLYGELLPHGIGVTVCAPGFFPSPLIERGAFPNPEVRELARSYANRATLTAEQVAADALRAVQRKKLYAVSGSRARWYWRLKRLAPAYFARLVSKQYRKNSNQQ